MNLWNSRSGSGGILACQRDSLHPSSFFDRQRKNYKKIPVKEQVEVLSFAGNIVQKDGKPRLHAHGVVGKADGTAHGGHFLGGARVI